MITLTNLSPELPDGLGAQLQRRAAVFEIAEFLDVHFLCQPVMNFGFNPGDGVGDDEPLKLSVLGSMNKLFHLPESRKPVFDEVVDIPQLTFSSLIKLMQRKQSSKDYLVRIGNPFPVFDKLPTKYDNVRRIWSDNFLGVNKQEKDFQIDLHIRRAVTPKETRLSRNYIRHMATDWYIDLVATAKEYLGSSDVKINIHTDGTKDGLPISLEKYSLDEGTKKLWSEQGFLENGNWLRQNVEDFADQFSRFGSVNVFREIRPDEALNLMVSSSLLIGAKSSFSYVAGLARGMRPVIFSKFWHKNPREWLTVSERPRKARLLRYLDKSSFY
jgi:hypothetical protein